MTALPQQTLDVLRSSAPFDQLGDDAMQHLAHKAVLVYVSDEASIALLNLARAQLFLIHSGQFSVKDSDQAERHVSEGDYFGVTNLTNDLQHEIEITVDKAGLVYCFPKDTFEQCCDGYPGVARFFQQYAKEELQNEAVATSKSMWLHKPIVDVLTGPPIAMEQHKSILEGAQCMAQNRVSSLLITAQDQLVGIITDRDLRNRVVAENLATDNPLSAIMTPEPASIEQQRTLFDALCQMTENNIHHLPVIDRANGQPVGILTASDMIRHQRGNVLFVLDELAKAPSLYALTRLSWQLPHYFAKHARRLGDFDVAGKVLAQATDIMTRRLITFYQQQHGTPPFDFCWLVYGSQAREDQTMGSDQDNGLLLEREPDEQEAAYFADMSEYVCQGLAKCGIKLCNGNIMAMNPDLRLSLDQAVAEARRWVQSPTPKAIMHFNIFLDVRSVAGDSDLFARLQDARRPLLQQSMFLAALARHANEVSVPLSMFQKFVYAKDHTPSDCIDLKVNAVAIINNLVRLYALAQGLGMPSTLARLRELPADAGLAEKDANNLRDIWLFLNRLRWRHQLDNNVTDNLVSVSQLSSIERHQLKAAFQAIKRAQQGAVMKFSGGMG
ncbi:DUF294 nucleotidyltransferase-like domain-containing protein [Aestuariibacter halophilus]|uniref:DUF294 nucleotidyltransferase-like domain-containing protein n=1 Tax=Fluctibacter halophilus TaxID=226011 RepID=A0ABS8G886_9ALTE|nr:DUF294 nucleotidyltransferase-like domain-containing protein [Aestuariibacter halophilus]MCC2616376.1 DUF294 nucleotidyltransferase-like domain-containing protein [Aestuariibacter halophilus]